MLIINVFSTLYRIFSTFLDVFILLVVHLHIFLVLHLLEYNLPLYVQYIELYAVISKYPVPVSPNKIVFSSPVSLHFKASSIAAFYSIWYFFHNKFLLVLYLFLLFSYFIFVIYSANLFLFSSIIFFLHHTLLI